MNGRVYVGLVLLFVTSACHATETIQTNRLPVTWQAPVLWKASAKSMEETIARYIAGHVFDGKSATPRKLYVAYVCPADREPLPRYRERWTAILRQIQCYYADQMREHGFPPFTFGLEIGADGLVVMHEARLGQPLAALEKYAAGPITRNAVAAVLKARGIDPDQNHLLIVCQMPDGKSPYYGAGNHESGTCWACDLPYLEPARLTDRGKGVHVSSRTIGDDNTTYLGGAAHELGHAFGLCHNKEDSATAVYGVSLMGAGNYAYGRELRGMKTGAFLSQLDAAQLASVPLFRGAECTPRATPNLAVELLSAKTTPAGFTFNAMIKSDIPVYAVGAFLDPDGGQDYDSTTSLATVSKTGNFTITMARKGVRGIVALRLALMHVNGRVSMYTIVSHMTDDGFDVFPIRAYFDFAPVQSAWMRGALPEARKALDACHVTHGALPNDPLVKLGLAWRRTLAGGEPPVFELSDCDALMVDLTTIKPLHARSGWGPVMYMAQPANENGPVPCLATGPVTGRFIHVHAVGALSYALNGSWKTFSVTVGVRIGSHGSVAYRVLADGVECAKTDVLRAGQCAALTVPVADVKTLEIQVLDGGNGNGGDWGLIIDPRLMR